MPVSTLHLSILALILTLTYAAVDADKMTRVPGYPENYTTKVYSGYLDVGSVNRSLHYVFVESAKGTNNSDPVTLWLNGGPGCSSMLGFLQEIGPYYMKDGQKYKEGDLLQYNPYSWHNVSNLLFLESPAGVGFSYNLDLQYQYNDHLTAMDNYNGLLDFFKKYPEFSQNRFWIAGQSYAGKYIPDLAVLLDQHNQRQTKKINFRGIMVGNGVMTFQNSDIQNAQIDYMIGHSFVDPLILHYYDYSCKNDPDSAGCMYFQIKYSQNVEEINPYNVYGYCFYNDSFATNQGGQRRSVYESQQSLLKKIIKKNSPWKDTSKSDDYNGAPCAYFDGLLDYFNINQKAYHAKFDNMKWNGPCAQNITYNIDVRGSMEQYTYLLGRSNKYTISLYNGDWDDVIPYQDTIKNMRALNLVETYTYNPWFTNGQHSGFIQLFSGVVFTTFKGASHQVPQSKRAEALEFFNLTLQGHKMFTPPNVLNNLEIVQQ